MISEGDEILDTYKVIYGAIKGGMGSVWKVHHKGWNADLAMKRPQSKYFAEGSRRRKDNFIHECEAWINLGLHPNILPNRANTKEWICILSTDTEMEENEIIRQYGKRWNIE